MTDILMPRLTDQMEEGTIVAWLVADGDVVSVGQEILEIETDKATMTYSAEADGVFTPVVAEGETVAVGELIAQLSTRASSEEADASSAIAERSDDSAAAATEPAITRVAASDGRHSTETTDRVLVTPLARRVAAVHEVDLAELAGSGPGGRVTKQDVLRAAGIDDTPDARERAAAPDATRKSPEPDQSPPHALTTRVQRPTRLQQVVARRMLEATTTVPHFQVMTEVEIDGALALRAQLKAAADGATAPSVNDLVVKACACALREHPLVNGSYIDDAFELHDEVHVGIAVAADDGLLVATIRDADIKSLGQIARDARHLAEKVRTGDATPAELTGATFTVSNLGMFGMTAITPVINPPQAAILGVGAARTMLARAEDGEIVDRQVLTLTLSADHRILNGADASRFLSDVKAILEQPLRLAL